MLHGKNYGKAYTVQAIPQGTLVPRELHLHARPLHVLWAHHKSISKISNKMLALVVRLSLPAFVAKIKCSICSSQCDSWDRGYTPRLLSP